VAGEQGPRAAVAGDNLEHPGREASLLDESSHGQGGERGLLRRLEDEDVPRRQRRPSLHAYVAHGSVPGDDAGAHAERLVPNNLEETVLLRICLPGKLIRPAGKVPKALGGEAQLKDTERLPGRTERQAGQGRQRLGILVDEVGQLVEAVAALSGGGLAPRLEGLSAGGDGGIDVLLAGQADIVGDELAILGVEDLDFLGVG
jgi:hypothetical protein